MKFIVDAQLPRRLARELAASGHDAVHTLDFPAGNRTPDEEIVAVAVREGRVVMTPDMLNVEWNAVALYPAGYFSRQITFEPSVRLPDGFKLASALETASVDGPVTVFKPTPFNTLVDSPLIARASLSSITGMPSRTGNASRSAWQTSSWRSWAGGRQ